MLRWATQRLVCIAENQERFDRFTQRCVDGCLILSVVTSIAFVMALVQR